MALRDLFSWLRLSGAEVSGARDGMPWQSLGISGPERWALRIARKWISLQPWFQIPGGARIARTKLADQVDSSASLGVITLKREQAVSGSGWVEAGRLSMRAWLILTRWDYSLHPLTLPAFGMLATRAGVWDPPISLENQARFLSGESVMRREVAVAPDEVAVWAFRAGKPASPPEFSIPRRTVSELLKKVAKTKV